MYVFICVECTLSIIYIVYGYGFTCSWLIVTPHVQREWGKVIDRGVHIYVCSRKKYLNRTLEIDSPFQTLTVGLLVEFID